MQNTDWDIFRYVIAVADSGSAVAAAEKLGVNGSTVLRRISKFEEQRGIRLFDRLASGYTPTMECEALIKTAREIQESIAIIDLGIAGQDLRFKGQLTVTVTDTLLEAVVSDIIMEFCQENPQIKIDIAVTNDRLNLTKRDADVAIRASKNPPEHLIGVRVSPLSFAIYGARTVFDTKSTKRNLQDLLDQPWIGTAGFIAESPVKQWMEKHVPPESVVVTTDTFPGMRSCLRKGGVGVMPCCIGEGDDKLIKLLPAIKEVETSLWVLTHPDVQKSAKVKAFSRHVSKRLREKQPLLSCV